MLLVLLATVMLRYCISVQHNNNITKFTNKVFAIQ